jgi:hypothetical protein
MASETGKLFPFNNVGLFSDHFLSKRLPAESPLWSRLLEKGKVLFERCLAKNDFLCVSSFVDHCLKQMPEQADVVHDLLAFLAQRMIELNKKKRAEIRSFLEWLEATVGAKVGKSQE